MTSALGVAERLDRPVSRARSRQRRQRRQLTAALPFMLPGLVLVLAFVVWPLVKGIQMSLYDWNLAVPARSTFVGLANFSLAVAQVSSFWGATRVIVLGAVVTVPVQMVLGGAAAGALNV